MTKKDYSLIAFYLNDEMQKWKHEDNLRNVAGFARAIIALTGALKADNPRFNEKRFWDAAWKGNDYDYRD